MDSSLHESARYWARDVRRWQRECFQNSSLPTPQAALSILQAHWRRSAVSLMPEPCPVRVEVHSQPVTPRQSVSHRLVFSLMEFTMSSAGFEPLDSETFRFPVVCAFCGRESLFHALRREITQALTTRGPIRLSSPCCDNEGWFASEIETEQIRQYADLPPGQFAV
jgi:hypothetical protein